ncbi:NrsF family protein [Sinorhizobium mexicanum]|uniref:NrsF family protein n=1 Tax=Sinorhizobium mexicanum TaxID=375549 RepID=UPI001D8CFE27|nr:NrsF family protein [Sinorhizobium mexicanum]MBP1886604.1 hypothetical protein [Sinorhizobium mexicanum]
MPRRYHRGIIFFSVIGFRPEIDTAVQTGRFLFKFVITIASAVSGAKVLFQIGRPSVPLRLSALSLLLPVGLAIGATIFELIVMPPETWSPSLSLGPLACFIYAMRNGAPERPGLAGAIA